MKTKLEHLTTAEFIDMLCGKSDVLLGKHEIQSPRKIVKTMHNIIMEYRSIADPAGNAAYIKRIDSVIKARLTVAICMICQSLVGIEEYDKARKILISAGCPANDWSNQRIESEIHIRIHKAKRKISELEESSEKEGDKANIRDLFNSMIAAMMAHFKFQIDICTMMAPVFAHLVARHHTEIKEMQKAIDKIKKR